MNDSAAMIQISRCSVQFIEHYIAINVEVYVSSSKVNVRCKRITSWHLYTEMQMEIRIERQSVFRTSAMTTRSIIVSALILKFSQSRHHMPEFALIPVSCHSCFGLRAIYT